jgi:branched-chain amino acid transport system ATP-binding protein
VLELREVCVAYGRTEVLHGVSLLLEENGVLGLVGPNGAGKTALLRAICGLLAPSRGAVTFRGQLLNGRKPEKIAELGIRLVPEGRQIFRTLTVADNIRLGIAAGAEEVERVLHHFPVLKQRSAQHADRLSGGEQQMLALARALVGKPRLLLIDEPSLGLAPRVIDTVYELLADFRCQGMAMLLVEQNPARAEAFCDRCLSLSDGRLSCERPRERAISTQAIAPIPGPHPTAAVFEPHKQSRKEADVD